MISARIPRALLYTNPSSPAGGGGFRTLSWTWGSLEKDSAKYHHHHSARRNTIPKCIHRQSRRNSSLSHPPSSIPSSDVDQTSTPIDSPSETIPSGDVDQADIPLDSSSETIPNSNVGQADTPIDSPSEASDESPKLESLSDEVRKVMRHVPYPVVVLTTPHLRLTPEGHPTRLAGMTLSSFNTLSLSPDPIITFNIKRPSPTLDALKSTQDPDIISVAPSERERRFHIHILQANTAGLKIAHQFSRGGPISDEDLAMVSRSRVGSKSWPYPMAKGVRRVFECEVLQEAKGSFIDVNDHTLVIGRVKKIVEKTRTSVVKEIEWSGLCYMHGSYHTADCLVNQDVKGKEQRLEVKEDGENLEGSMLEEGKKADS